MDTCKKFLEESKDPYTGKFIARTSKRFGDLLKECNMNIDRDNSLSLRSPSSLKTTNNKIKPSKEFRTLTKLPKTSIPELVSPSLIPTSSILSSLSLPSPVRRPQKPLGEARKKIISYLKNLPYERIVELVRENKNLEWIKDNEDFWSKKASKDFALDKEEYFELFDLLTNLIPTRKLTHIEAYPRIRSQIYAYVR